jgi:hypothetical protein
MRRSLIWAAGSLFLPAVVVLGPAASPSHADDFVPGPGIYRVDTDDLVITGPGGGDLGNLVGGVAVFDFDQVLIGPEVTLDVTGSRPVRFESRGRMDVRGVISAQGASAPDGQWVVAAGGPGGWAGGPPDVGGAGPGGGAPGDSLAGAAGGGHGGRGARGALASATGGSAYSGVPTVLRGGSGGGGGPLSGGGGGGGAVELRAAQLTIAPGAQVNVDGGGGAAALGGGTGGGSGGGLVLRADRLSVQGQLLARGGAGGVGNSTYGNGGGGGGGRVVLIGRHSLTVDIAPAVNGGLSGARSSSGCCFPGLPGPDLVGEAGQVVQITGTRLAASANRTVRPGATVTFTTKLQSLTTPLAGRAVTLWRRSTTGSIWQRVGTAVTTTAGNASTRLRVPSSGRYQWRFAGTTAYLPSVSPQSSVTVRR